MRQTRPPSLSGVLSMKYIVVSGPGGEVPVLFGQALHHRWVATHFGGPGNVISAGFVQLRGSEIECHGHSSSLGIESRPDADSRLVQRHLDVGTEA
jgi:hypothetical protein